MNIHSDPPLNRPPLNRPPLNQLTLTQALSLCNTGKSTVEQIVHACYDRIEAREQQVGAWQYMRSRTEYLDIYHNNKDFYKNSVLKGLPVAIKDIIDTADMPTELGSPIYQGRCPPHNATCVSRLLQAGAIVMGKTVTTEFAYFRPGKTANPCNLAHTPGGSSSGSVASVADGMVPVALGSQTGGSVIRPAAYCGIIGYVATPGEMSLRGVLPLAQSLDSLGIFARSCEDIYLLRSLILSHSPNVQPIDIQGVKIVRVHGDDVGECSPDMHRAMDMAAQNLKQQGVQVIQGKFGNRLHQLGTIHAQIMAFEVARNIVEETAYLDKISPQFKELLSQGTNMTYAEYKIALSQRDTIADWIRDTYGGCDGFLAPSAPGAAPLGLDATGSPHMSRPWQALACPAVSYPVYGDDNGLPLSVQLIGHPHSDDMLLQLAGAVHPTQ